MMLNGNLSVFLSEFLTSDINNHKAHINLAYDMSFSPPWKIDKRVIKDYLITFIRDGSADYYLNNKLYKAQKGSIIFIDNSTTHYANNASKNFHAMGFRFIFSDANEENVKYKNQVSFIHNLSDANPITHNINLIIRNYKSDNIISQNICKHSIYAIMFSIYNQLDSDIWFDNLRNYVDQNITKRISHYELSKQAGLSKDYLNKVFKEKYNMTIKHYIYTKKMEYAKYLLLETNDKISEISSILGYSDQYIFSNMYKKHWGVSPRTSRKNNTF